MWIQLCKSCRIHIESLTWQTWIVPSCVSMKVDASAMRKLENHISVIRSKRNPRSRCAWLTGPEPRWGYARTSFGVDAAAEVTISKCNLWKSWSLDYSTGVQIVSCTLSDDSVLSESTGLFNPVLCVSQWNLFWQKNQPMRSCLSNQVRSAREWFPSPLGDFIRLFEGLIGELFQIWHWNMFYFFKWHQSGP